MYYVKCSLSLSIRPRQTEIEKNSDARLNNIAMQKLTVFDELLIIPNNKFTQRLCFGWIKFLDVIICNIKDKHN